MATSKDMRKGYCRPPGGTHPDMAGLVRSVDVERPVEEVYEPYLIQQGFLERTPRGRCATTLAYKRFGLTPPGRQTTIFDG